MNTPCTPPAPCTQRRGIGFLLLGIWLAVVVGGCSSARRWMNQPLIAAQNAGEAIFVADRNLTALSAVTLSGGGIMAAYFAAFGRDVLPRFEAQFLLRNFQNSLLYQGSSPSSLIALRSPWFGRSQLRMHRLDDLYHGTTFGDVVRRPRHPQLVVTATDMSLGTGFEFTADQLALICSDLDSVLLSFAVAA